MTSPTAGPVEPGTRQRLLLTALRLYATEGLYTVSLRRISAEAGSKNSAAMHYHFDNKLGVIRALVAMIAAELVRIDQQERAGQPAPASMREACRGILLPLARLPDAQTWGRDALRFISRLVSDTDPDLAEINNLVYAPFWQRMDKALSKQLPDLPAPIRQLRLMFMSTNVLHGAAEVAWLAHSPLGDLSHFDNDTLLDHLVDYLIGGLTAPSKAPNINNTMHKENTP